MFQNLLFIMNIIIGSDNMKLVVGLGNPGKEYQNTRHNIGFDFVDYYLKKNNILDSWTKKFDGYYLQTKIGNDKVLFLKPQTYMNLSGTSVRKIMDYFNISTDDILIVVDDMDLLVGNFKLRPNGSSAGHNGLKNIEANIGSNEYKRLKIGISKNTDSNAKDYVLGQISKTERENITTLFDTLCNVIDDYFQLPFGDLMSKYNRKNR